MALSRHVHSSWLAVLVATAFACSGCREQPSAQAAAIPQHADETRQTDTTTAEPESEADRVIRQELDAVIEHDSALKNRAIRFKVAAGDVTVTGIVGTETERQKINELAMQVNGVKSVANAVRVSPSEGGN
jgi:BON domain-containing protein